MFQALQTLLATCVSLGLNLVANADGTITVSVFPKTRKDGESHVALNTPLVLTGTAEELDAEFVNILAGFANTRSSLAEQLEATEAVLEAAKKDSVSKATTAITKKPAGKATTTAKKTAGGGSDADSDDDENAASPTAGQPDGSGEPAASSEVTAAPAAATPGGTTAPNLWD